MADYNFGPDWFWKLIAALAFVGAIALAGIIVYLIIQIGK